MSSNPSWWIFFGCSELLFGPLSWIFDSQPIANLIQLQCFLRWASILDDCSNPCSPIHVEKKLPSTLSLILRNKSERNVSWRRPSLYSVLSEMNIFLSFLRYGGNVPICTFDLKILPPTIKFLFSVIIICWDRMIENVFPVLFLNTINNLETAALAK